MPQQLDCYEANNLALSVFLQQAFSRVISALTKRNVQHNDQF